MYFRRHAKTCSRRSANPVYPMDQQTVKKQLYADGLISIIRGSFGLRETMQMAEALLAGGVKIVEVTLNSTNALAGIRDLQRQFGQEMQVGAGTIRSADDVQKAVDAGASFLIAPCLDLPSVEAAAQQGTLLLPGIFTASEAQAAFVAGCQTVKLFPAEVGGSTYLKALRAPLEHIDFIPTGGVTSETITDFHRAGAVAFGVGSALVKNVAMTPEELTALTERAAALTRALKKARAGA